MTIGEYIKGAMKARKLSAAEVARRAGTNRQNIYDIIKGRNRKPSAALIVKIATALELDLEDIFGASEGQS